MNYIQRIRDLREDADCTQTQIAEYLGTSQTMYARYERGANEMPIRHLIALCQYYQVSADYEREMERQRKEEYRHRDARSWDTCLIFELSTEPL